MTQFNYKTIKPHLIPSVGSLWSRNSAPEMLWHVTEVRCDMNNIIYLERGKYKTKIHLTTLLEHWTEKKIDDVWGEK
jgi:hypothetical protein|tara:strand:+ start:858 stop:1088 length:231 start_codon:yes stop_codon:yes gene_type:complete